MGNVLRFDSIHDYNAFNKQSTLHPLVSIAGLSKADPRESHSMGYGFYTIFLDYGSQKTLYLQ
ncbi:hypothetical protein [Dyadobacter sp. LHD-138]|uniref:hypothetical protein n=1 Tax=Dyadobacter sp. LHD-138 TaxID=3071413 RepID=UPI0027DF2E96|nr:hypothetical protein [Dyadobacter sp. LHD-138]MDQ6481768.1 hypothetical protein [Dyadobacter sp. LHD-138]